jgi:hypothetical protein
MSAAEEALVRGFLSAMACLRQAKMSATLFVSMRR